MRASRCRGRAWFELARATCMSRDGGMLLWVVRARRTGFFADPDLMADVEGHTSNAYGLLLGVGRPVAAAVLFASMVEMPAARAMRSNLASSSRVPRRCLFWHTCLRGQVCCCLSELHPRTVCVST